MILGLTTPPKIDQKYGYLVSAGMQIKVAWFDKGAHGALGSGFTSPIDLSLSSGRSFKVWAPANKNQILYRGSKYWNFGQCDQRQELSPESATVAHWDPH